MPFRKPEKDVPQLVDCNSHSHFYWRNAFLILQQRVLMGDFNWSPQRHNRVSEKSCRESSGSALWFSKCFFFKQVLKIYEKELNGTAIKRNTNKIPQNLQFNFIRLTAYINVQCVKIAPPCFQHVPNYFLSLSPLHTHAPVCPHAHICTRKCIQTLDLIMDLRYSLTTGMSMRLSK